jgi:hypothetical protein
VVSDEPFAAWTDEPDEIAEPADSVTRKVRAPGVTRTPGTQFRKLLLYPPELRGRKDLRDAAGRF